jgi:predicted DNA-binding transcriptional regulator YafY
MRASRLLSILTTLQAKGLVSAETLAAECEVSVRTIYRDIDALAAAGVPVYAERGSAGGYRLLDGYKVRLNGLSAREAEALFLVGLAGPAGDLGLGSLVDSAERKLAAALPESQRTARLAIRDRFHLDAPGWFGSPDQPDCLRQLAEAVWGERVIEIRYRSWKGERMRRIHPLGLVLKGGSWYLAAAVDKSVRTYRVSRIDALQVTNDVFVRPDGFDLTAYWQENTERLEAELHPTLVRVRLSPLGARILPHIVPPYVLSRMVWLGETGPDGWREATLPGGRTPEHVTHDLLRLGTEVEILDPPDIRAHMAEVVRKLAGIYGEEDV